MQILILNQDIAILGEWRQKIDILNLKEMKITHSSSFIELQYIRNIFKTRSKNEIAICTETQGLRYLKINVKNQKLLLLDKDFYPKLMSSIENISGTKLAVFKEHIN